MRRILNTLVCLTSLPVLMAVVAPPRAMGIELLVVVAWDGRITTTDNSRVVDLTDPDVRPEYLREFWKSTINEAAQRTVELQQAAGEKSQLSWSFPRGSNQRQMAAQSEAYYQVAAAYESAVVSLLGTLPRTQNTEEALEICEAIANYQGVVRQYTQLGYSFSPWKTALDKKVLSSLAPANKLSTLEVRLDFIELLVIIHDTRFIIAIL